MPIRTHSVSIFTLATAFLVVLAMPAQAANITCADWGTTSQGQKVDIFTLKGAGGLEARITDYGGRIVNLMVPDRNGHKADIELGYDNLASYEGHGIYGALVGRYINRIGNNASFPLDGKIIHLQTTRPNQKIVMHGGSGGFQNKVWQAKMHDGVEPSLTLTLVSPDGEAGFPGTVKATVTYTVTRDNALKLDYRATTDKPTVLNLSNHSYFNLGGEGSGNVDNERLQVFADRYTPSEADGLPTGEILPVAGTPLDFRKPVRLGDVFKSSFIQIAQHEGLDINMVVNGKPGTLRPAARLVDPSSGRVMEVLTTQPGMTIYSDNIGQRTSTGKNGHQYGDHNAMSFETQHYPDSPNHPNFPSTEITPHKPLHEVTVFKFSNE